MIPTPSPLEMPEIAYSQHYHGELLTPPKGNRKFQKTSEASGGAVLQYGLTLASTTDAGIQTIRGKPWSACGDESRGCARACTVGKSAQGQMPTVVRARISKTRFFWHEPELFLFQLCAEIVRAQAHAQRLGARLLVRLNVNSDILWSGAAHPERPQLVFGIPQRFPHIHFGDYTAHKITRAGWTPEEIPENWHLTYSRKERRDQQTAENLERGRNAAVVFHNPGAHISRAAWKQQLPEFWTFNGIQYPVIDGDKTDDRRTDGSGVIVGLRLKSPTKAQRDFAIKTGFSIEHVPS